MENLTPEEINRRMIQWRNDRRLEPIRKKRMEELEDRCARLERENAELKLVIEKLLLRIEQLEGMVFGRKKKPDDHHDRPSSSSGSGGSSLMNQRPDSSYRRPSPRPEDITHRTEHVFNACPECHHPLRRRERVIRYVEDIPLSKKMVTEQTIERGFCSQCRKTKSAMAISPQHTTLGPNVRLYVLFAVTVLGQTFKKIKTQFLALHVLAISDGELAVIIQEGHRKLLPELSNIESKIRAAPVAHYDETSWPMQKGGQGNYAWVKTSGIGPETVFRLGRSRGKGNALELRGEASSQVGVSDDYGSYDALFERHALCWAHPLRKFRDLAISGVLSKQQHEHCLSFYERFHALERKVALTITVPLSEAECTPAATKLKTEMTLLMAPEILDPPALAKLKKTFLQNREKYLLCVRIPNVPMTNNKAERSLRHLVIKRLISFGSRSQRGAQAMETLLSVLLTLWWSRPKNFFGQLQSIIARG